MDASAQVRATHVEGGENDVQAWAGLVADAPQGREALALAAANGSFLLACWRDRVGLAAARAGDEFASSTRRR